MNPHRKQRLFLCTLTEIYRFPRSKCVRSLMTSPAMINPTTEGTNAVEPGISRRSVHFLAVPGGQMQWLRQLMAASSTGRIGFSCE